MTAGTEDPEQARIDCLLNRVRQGSAGDAELEELVLYARDNPERQGEIERGLAQEGLGAGWLDRVERDRHMQQLEKAPRIKTERTIGLALLLGGLGLGWLVPPWGGVATILGALILTVSFVRVRLRTHREDPYRDVVQ